jgi:prolyl 4-hydroxylase
VISAEAREVHQGRTSHSAMLRATGDPVLNAVYQRASHLLGMPEAYLEYGQCVSYTKGQEYQPHFDTLDEKSPLGKETIARYGQRAITLLVYLNDDFEGGETYFPNLDCKVSPKKGTAVVFHLLDKDYRVDPYALHAGLPVFSGRKYAFNLWVWNKPFRKLSQ